MPLGQVGPQDAVRVEQERDDEVRRQRYLQALDDGLEERLHCPDAGGDLGQAQQVAQAQVVAEGLLLRCRTVRDVPLDLVEPDDLRHLHVLPVLRRLHGRGIAVGVLEERDDVAEGDLVAVDQSDGDHRLAVDVRAVLALQVLQVPAGVAAHEDGVLAGDGAVVEGDVAVRPAPHPDALPLQFDHVALAGPALQVE